MGGVITCIFPVLCHYKLIAQDPEIGNRSNRLCDIGIIAIVFIIMITTSILSLIGSEDLN